MARTVEEIQKEINKVDDLIFCEEMADFLDRKKMSELEQRLAGLKRELAEAQR